MKKLQLISMLLIFSILIGFNSCKDEREDNDNNTGTTPTVYRMNITGKVYDENHIPLTSVEVKIGNTTVTTDYNGVSIFKNVSVPSDRYVIAYKKQGYFDNSRSGKVIAGGSANIDLSMHSISNNDAYTNQVTIDPASGGQLDIGTYASIRFPAGVELVDESGNTYTGTFTVSAMYSDPTTDDFTRYIAMGEQIGKTENGDEKYLNAFGGITVMLTDQSGNRLEISASSDSLPEIALEIPSSLLTNAPDSIDRWYNGSDGEMAYASQKGSGKKNGTKYVAACEHFSAWTFQQAYDDKAIVNGQVTDCNGEPVPAIRVQVGQNYAITDMNGNYSQEVPAGVSGLLVYVDDIDYFGSGTTPEVLEALSANQEKTINLQVDCQGVITGRLVDCNNKAVPGNVTVSGGQTIYTSNGTFRLITNTNNTYVSLKVSTGNYYREVLFNNVTYPLNAGDILMCPPPANSNYVTYHDTTISTDQDPYAYSYNDDITIEISEESGQYNYAYINIVNYTGTGDYTIADTLSNLSINLNGSSNQAVSGTITVEADNGEGGRMWGRINATDIQGAPIIGKFNIIHPSPDSYKKK